MRRIAIVGLLILGCGASVMAQKASNSSGSWSDASAWTPAGVPTGTSGVCSSGSAATGTCNLPVSIGHAFTIDVNVSITTGVFYFGYNGTTTTGTNVTDAPGNTAYSITMDNPNAYSTTECILDIKSGTTTFEGALTMDDANIYVRSGATLVIGSANILNNTNMVIDGTLIINGNFVNGNNGSGTISIGNTGIVYVNGNYSASNGGVDIAGSGQFYTTGSITQIGSSDIFGNTGNCSGPCDGRNFCAFTNSLASSQVVCNGSAPTSLTATTNVAGTWNTYWESSTTSAATGFSQISGTAGSSSTSSFTSYSPPALTQNTWYRFYVNKTNGTACDSWSLPVQMAVVSAPGGWIGTTKDWHTASNWCGSSIPTSTSDITITPMPTALGRFMPEIATGNTGDVRNLTILSSPYTNYLNGQVTLAGTGTLNIYGNLTNDDLFSDNVSSQVNFVGTSNQTIGGASITTFTNVNLNNSSPSQPAISLANNNLIVGGTLTLTQGNVNLNSLTMQLGTSTSSLGTLSRTAGWMYGGNMMRYVGTAAATQLFPLGSSANYRPITAANTALTSGGFLRISHTGTVGVSTVNFEDTGDDAAATPVIRRSDSYWTINSTGVTAGGSPYSLTAGGTGLGTVTDLNHLRLTQSGSAIGTWTTGSNSGSVTDIQVVRSAISVANLANNFYVGSTNIASPLPVTLSEFDAYLTKEGVSLNWSTLTEVNADYFEIEKSTNGYDFKAIGRISAQGNSSAKIDYSFLDQNTLFSKAYYRLKSTDVAIGNAAAAFEYSKVISVEKPGFHNYGVLVVPNPINLKADKTFTILVGDGNPMEGQVMLCDLSGRVISKELRNNVQGEYQTSDNLPSGFYFLKVYTSTIRQTVKVVVK